MKHAPRIDLGAKRGGETGSAPSPGGENESFTPGRLLLARVQEPAPAQEPEPEDVVVIRSKSGAGGISHRYGLDFNASDRVRCTGEAAARARLAIKECPHEYEAVVTSAIAHPTKS